VANDEVNESFDDQRAHRPVNEMTLAVPTLRELHVRSVVARVCVVLSAIVGRRRQQQVSEKFD